jgi:hypothetical protein
MFVGKTPFDDQTDYLIFQKVKKGKYPLDASVILYFNYAWTLEYVKNYLPNFVQKDP